MNIALAQINFLIGDFDFNVNRIKECIREAMLREADLVVFSELSVCGYPPGDFLEFSDFIEQSQQAINSIAKECTHIAAIIGAPSPNPADKGKPLYNSAWFLSEGKVRGIVHKTLLPNYDVFDEYRYFEPNRLPYQIIEYQGVRFAITICEDLWNVSDDPLYVRDPMTALMALQPDVIINIAASPFHYNQPAARRNVLAKNASRYHLPLFYVNQVGGQTELLFDGGSMVVSPEGNIVEELEQFQEAIGVYRLEEVISRGAGIPPSGFPRPPSVSTIELIHDALVMGVRDYFHKMGFQKAILGLSGGIDSAVTLIIAKEALGKENVRAVLLPSRFSSEHSIADAKQLAENTGVHYDIIRIEQPFSVLESTLHPFFNNLPFNLTEENIQARIRAVILMALANKFGYILLNTSNKSEAAVGYGTIYGDMCGGLSVLGDVYKTQIYELAGFINRSCETIPQNTILKPPSAELRYGQKDSDSLPEYAILDDILFQYIEQKKGPKELIGSGFDATLVKRVLKLVNTNEWKRYQTPPILRVSLKAFGTGRRMPIVAKYLL